ncbi:hypothetical protein FA13DRAFT_997274 [Coprinellus micaceus]|uniref:Uncharacterized protein n=1 Tax=Coprinellus micaceus TaxID=71717 RepID=A0A4Y7SYR8_COPMI|nr:hypothetical protein FA13DRAFT_997274 [Coprinellus micaceus]
MGGCSLFAGVSTPLSSPLSELTCCRLALPLGRRGFAIVWLGVLSSKLQIAPDRRAGRLAPLLRACYATSIFSTFFRITQPRSSTMGAPTS